MPDIDFREIEIRAWPPGSAYSPRSSAAVLALHTPTGVAVVASSEPTRERNQKLAVERVKLLLTEATSPGGWTR